MTMREFLTSYGPLAVVAAGGLVTWGMTAATVQANAAEVDELKAHVQRVDERQRQADIARGIAETQARNTDRRLGNIEDDVRLILLELRRSLPPAPGGTHGSPPDP